MSKKLNWSALRLKTRARREAVALARSGYRALMRGPVGYYDSLGPRRFAKFVPARYVEPAERGHIC